jgi:hypothetical protein
MSTASDAPISPVPDLLTPDQLAARVGQSPRLIRRLCDERRIASRLVAKRRLLTLDDWVASLKSTVKPALGPAERVTTVRRASGGRPLKDRAARKAS